MEEPEKVPIEPLKFPKKWPDIDCPRKRIQDKFPIIGIILGVFFTSRHQHIGSQTIESLCARKIEIEEAWENYPEYYYIVRLIQKILTEHLGFKPVFIPEDSYFLIGWVLVGDLTEMGILQDIEGYFSIRFPDDFFTHGDFTMFEMVKYIKSQTKISKSKIMQIYIDW